MFTALCGGGEPGNYPKRRPVVNARGVEDAAPYNYGAWGLLPDYTLHFHPFRQFRA